MTPEVIVMLTQNDRTVPNAVEVFDAAKDAKATWWGFKEVGIPMEEMRTLADHMKKAGKRIFLEVVAYTEAECLDGAKIGVELGVDTLMGTLYFDSVAKLLQENGIKYMPFVGELTGRPTVMNGTIEGIIAEGACYRNNPAVHGIDLLGYRYTGDADKLNLEFVKAMGPDFPVCLAGSINSFERLDAVKRFGPESFTIGSAFFEHKFGADKSFAEQIDAVVDYMNR